MHTNNSFRFEGASILVVKGERNLRTCGLLEHNDLKQQTQNIFLPGANRQVKVIYESNAQEIDSKELNEPINVYNTSDTHKLSVNVSLERDPEFPTDTNNNNTVPHNTIIDEKDLEMLYRTAASYVHKHKDDQRAMRTNGTRKLRHTTISGAR